MLLQPYGLGYFGAGGDKLNFDICHRW